MLVAQDHLATIRKAVGAVLRRHGFRVRSKREWVRGDDKTGWVVVAWWGDKWNTKKAAEATLTATVWPAGTREHRSEVFATEIEAWAGDGPVLSAGPPAANLAGPDTFAAKNTTSVEEVATLASAASAYAEELVQWADSMLDAHTSAPYMRDDVAVAALLVQHPGHPVIDSTLDRLTADFQRDPRPMQLASVIQRWRRQRGLAEVPMPAWSRYASRPHPSGKLPSPRDELLAGLGTGVDFQLADGASRAPRPEDLPDVATIARWREERRLAPLPDGVLSVLPEWLPYLGWLDLPEPEPTRDPRRWWRR